MSQFTADQYREAAKKALAAGDTAAAQRLIAAGRALGQAPAPERSFGQTIYENVIGSGEVDTPGERFGAAVGDVMRSGGSGFVKGVTGLADLPGKVIGGMATAATAGLEKLGVNPEFAGAMRDSITGMPLGSGSVTSDAVDAVAPGVQGYQPSTTAGEFAQTAGEFLPGGMLAKAPMAFGIVPGLTSEAFGQMAEGQKFPANTPLIGGTDVEPWARGLGALAGPSVYNAAAKAITPNPTDPARIAAAQKLEGEGVRLTAGQKTGNVALRNREEYLPRTQQILQDQGDEFTSAALRRAGVQGVRAEPELMKSTFDRLGSAFDDLASRNKVIPDTELAQGKDAALRAYSDLTDAAPTQVLRDAAQRIDDALASGQPIDGSVYQSLRSRLGKAKTSSDSALREGANAMLNALDDAMGRSIQATGNVDDIAAYSQVRQQYRDMLAIERAATSAGENTALGIINPRQLRTATASQGRREYATGGRELGELARAGNAVMTQVPNSGTPDRLRALINALTAGPSTVAGGVLGHTLGGGSPAITAASTIAGLLAPAAKNAATGSAMGQRYLANQLLTNRAENMSPQMLAIISTLLGQSEKRPEQ